MSDRNERYDSGTGRTLEELEKVYFQKAETGSAPEPSPAAARRQTASRSTARRRSASNASARRTPQKSRPAKTGSKGLKNPLSGRTNKTPKRGRKNTAPARSRTAQADAGKVSDKLVFTPLPPEGYEAQAQQKAQEQIIAQANAIRDQGKGLLADHVRPHPGQLALGAVGEVTVEVIGDDHAQNGVAQKFQPLVAAQAVVEPFVGIGGMGQGILQQGNVPEAVADGLLQFM